MKDDVFALSAQRSFFLALLIWFLNSSTVISGRCKHRMYSWKYSQPVNKKIQLMNQNSHKVDKSFKLFITQK